MTQTVGGTVGLHFSSATVGWMDIQGSRKVLGRGGDWSSPFFCMQIDPIAIRRGRLCPLHSLVPTKIFDIPGGPDIKEEGMASKARVIMAFYGAKYVGKWDKICG